MWPTHPTLPAAAAAEGRHPDREREREKQRGRREGEADTRINVYFLHLYVTCPPGGMSPSPYPCHSYSHLLRVSLSSSKISVNLDSLLRQALAMRTNLIKFVLICQYIQKENQANTEAEGERERERERETEWERQTGRALDDSNWHSVNANPLSDARVGTTRGECRVSGSDCEAVASRLPMCVYACLCVCDTVTSKNRHTSTIFSNVESQHFISILSNTSYRHTHRHSYTLLIWPFESVRGKEVATGEGRKRVS